MFLMLILTHLIPAGEYQRVEDPVSGKMIVVPGSDTYKHREQAIHLFIDTHCGS